MPLVVRAEQFYEYSGDPVSMHMALLPLNRPGSCYTFETILNVLFVYLRNG